MDVPLSQCNRRRCVVGGNKSDGRPSSQWAIGGGQTLSCNGSDGGRSWAGSPSGRTAAATNGTSGRADGRPPDPMRGGGRGGRGGLLGQWRRGARGGRDLRRRLFVARRRWRN
ncbi:hypothetical protein chiPu_0024313 [Chiloscyllium punctatum]|uniref:Uncharacterized protein n=1 Tax=Chiloscyllium punctatum TaxID=137246 RepID=A0A401TC29_CHIPU|nr:hypothetical protein [Chiloscyllium punctatum]